MNGLYWLFLIAASLLTGGVFVKYLTVHPIRMVRYALLSLIGLGAVVGLFLYGYFNQLDTGIGAGLAVIALFAGYSVMTRVFLNRDDPREVPEITRKESDPGLGHLAVVYFTHGEPALYDPIGWINQFKEFEEQKIGFVPFAARPFFVWNLRNHYLKVGRSDHRAMHHQMMGRLEQVFRDRGDERTRFYISFLDDDPRPDAAVIRALNEGASKIVVAEVFLTISNHTAEGKELIEALEIEKRFGIPVHYTGPLYDSETLKMMFPTRLERHLNGTPREKVGVLLVGHGQPKEWDEEWPTETEQEIGFREDVLRKLSDAGFLPENMSLAWMEFKQPKPKQKVEEFYQRGLEQVYYFSAAISAEAMHSQYDVPALVHQADVPPDYPLINLGAWNDDPLVIQSIREKIDAVLQAGED